MQGEEVTADINAAIPMDVDQGVSGAVGEDQAPPQGEIEAQKDAEEDAARDEFVVPDDVILRPLVKRRDEDEELSAKATAGTGKGRGGASSSKRDNMEDVQPAEVIREDKGGFFVDILSAFWIQLKFVPRSALHEI